jgi:hypothetical protein
LGNLRRAFCFRGRADRGRDLAARAPAPWLPHPGGGRRSATTVSLRLQ